MKSKIVLLSLVLNTLFVFSQEAGNINYQTQTGNINHQTFSYPANNINVSLPSSNDIIVDVKGLANIKADTYVAVFNILQVGKTTGEVNGIMDKRIKSVLDKIKGKTNVSSFVDMLTFVPLYEYETEKKIFSKRTYNEVPTGFELKKSIHIEYKDPNFLNDLINICAENEIYDLVKVDYFSSNLETIKKELMNKAKLILKEKQKTYQEILSVDLAEFEKQLADAYIVKYPVEMYQSYQAYASTSLNFRRNSNINQANKSSTLYYQPIVDKEFDFVINPKIVEPAIQVMYEIKVRIIRPAQQTTKQNESKSYYIVTPNGDVKLLDLK